MREELYSDVVLSILKTKDSDKLTLQYGYSNLTKTIQPWKHRLVNPVYITTSISYGHLKVLKYIPTGTDIDFTPYIQIAVERQHHKIVKLLLPLVDTEQHTQDVTQWISTSAKHGNFDLIKVLRNFLFGDNLDNALTVAINKNKFKMVKYLVNNGANVRSNDNVMTYPIIGAISNGNLQIAKYLVSKGASLDEYYNFTTIVSSAVLSRSIPMVEYLMAMGVSFNTSALKYAISSDNIDMIKFLVSKGVTIDRPWVLTNFRLNSSDIVTIFEYILQNLPNVDIRLKVEDLLFVIDLGDINIIKHVLDNILYIRPDELNTINVKDSVVLDMINQKLIQQYEIFENAIRSENIGLVKDFLLKHIHIDHERLKQIHIVNPTIASMLNYYNEYNSIFGWSSNYSNY
jgi:ankyrin repeat protein